jgi:hypothetical protein
MNRVKIALVGLVLVLLAFGGGWLRGSSGRREAERQVHKRDAQYHLVTARGHLFEGRVELYNNNFGNAARAFDAAKGPLGAAIAELEKQGATAQTGEARRALSTVDEAIQRAGRLDPAAHQPVVTAIQAVDGALAGLAP